MGIVIVVKLVQPVNIRVLIVVNDGFVGSVTLDKGVFRSAPEPIVITELGIVIVVNPLFANALLPILVTIFPSVTSTKRPESGTTDDGISVIVEV